MKTHRHGDEREKDCLYAPHCKKTLDINSKHNICSSCRSGLAYWEALPMRRRLERNEQLIKLQARMTTVTKGRKK